MFAIIELKGHQYKVSNGDVIVTEKVDEEAGKELSIDKVLLYYDGKELKIGRPYIENFVVKGKVLEHFKGKKIVDFKYTAKKRYRRKKGHRQLFSKIEVSL